MNRGSNGRRGLAGAAGAGRMVAIAALLAAVLAVSVLHERTSEEEFAGAARVIDGDTLEIGGTRVRLAGIDAAEIDQVCLRDGAPYPCGEQSRDHLAGLVGAAAVACRARRRDAHGRPVAVCEADGVDLGRAMVAAGWAVAHGAYRDAEDAARRDGAGLWAGAFDAPRLWRQAHDRAETETSGAWAWPLGDWLMRAFAPR